MAYLSSPAIVALLFKLFLLDAGTRDASIISSGSLSNLLPSFVDEGFLQSNLIKPVSCSFVNLLLFLLRNVDTWSPDRIGTFEISGRISHSLRFRILKAMGLSWSIA